MKAELSEARHALLQRYLRGETKRASTIPKRTSNGPAPLSWSQQQIFLHSQVAGDTPIYNEPITIRRRGNLNIDALERAFTEMVRRHEAWRTTFEWEDDHGVQIVQPAPSRIEVPHEHLGSDAEAIRMATADARQPFNLARGPMYRLRLVSLGNEDHRLYLTLHHIIFDGVSLYRVFLPELLKFYEALAKGETIRLDPLPIQYPDYAAWQRTATPDFSYWQTVLNDPPALDLKTDRPRPAMQTYAGAAEGIEIPSGTTAALKALSQEQNASLFMTMTAAFLKLLQEMSGQEDIIVAGVSSGRHHAETMGLLGCFLNTVPIRCDVPRNLPFPELLARVRTATLAALSHDQVPFELLVQKFAPKRDRSRAPLVQALIVVEPPLDPLPEGWSFTHMDVDPGTAKFDLQLGLDDRAEGLTGRFIYNTDLFDRETILSLKRRWLGLLDEIAAPKNHSLGVSFQPADTHAPYPREAAIHRIFEEQVRAAPDATALLFEQTRLSYAELNGRANRFARHLQKLGVTRDQPVGIRMERSLELIVALLAVLKAGGAYLPLDPDYPEERLSLMTEDAQAAVILTRADVAELSDGDDTNLANEVRADDLAYIIYTSGSTGRPKGVAIPHRGVVRLVKGTNYCSFSPNETFLQLAPISFDASTFEIWGPLLNGGTLVILPPAPPTLEDIGNAIRAHGVTTLWLTSALFNAMIDERPQDLRPLRQLLAGGDVLSVAHVRKALRELPTTRLINGYGPTESTTFACCHTISPNESFKSGVPIGQPIANTIARILDSDLQPLAPGAAGELHLGGDGLARGYWRRPELTEKKFISQGAERFYKTGDLARWRDDGAIEFLGRIDNQIKLRGFRIEPGEIEAAFKQQPGVLDAAVVLRDERQLVAYFVGSALPAELMVALRKTLPDYMVPAVIVPLAGLPRTANGKLDRAALPAPKIGDASVAPVTALEKQLAGIWANVLGLERIGATDNFFELGGHSLLGLRLVNQLNLSLGKRIPLTLVFEAPTVMEMARRLTTNGSNRALTPIVSVNRESRRARRA